MIIVIVLHWCKLDMTEAGRQRIDKAANEMPSAPGFRFRYRIESINDSTKVSVLPAWDREVDFDKFRAGRPAVNLNDPSTPFERVERERFAAR
jgi:hypothetical protein